MPGGFLNCEPFSPSFSTGLFRENKHLRRSVAFSSGISGKIRYVDLWKRSGDELVPTIRATA